MEQVHSRWEMKEEEEEEEPKLQDAAAALKHRKDIATAVAPSFYSVEKQPLLQKEELFHTQKEQPTQRLTETNNVVAEFVENENAINGEAISSATTNVDASKNKNSVYFDKQQGMWKCHHCKWTKKFDGPWNVPRRNINGYSDWLKTKILHGPCFLCETKGNDINGAMSVLPKSIGEVDFDIRVENSDIQCSPCNEVNNQCKETVDDKVPSGSELLPMHNSSENEIQAATEENYGDENSAKAYPNFREEIDQQLKDYDVEAVLAKQETHDLFCPNCKSCITKRVIIRKRKRSIPIPNLDTKAKRDKLSTELVNGSIEETNQGDHVIATHHVGRVEPPADNYEPEREPEVFRCLSCFSFFIPVRNGIKLFPSFGGTRESETLQKPLVIPSSNVEIPSTVAASNANWFFSLFTSIKGRKASAQVDASIEDSRTDPASVEDSRVDNPESPLANTPISQSVNLTSDIKLAHGGAKSKIESLTEKGKKSNEPLVDQKDSKNFSVTEQLLSESVIADVGDKNRYPVELIKTDISKPESVLITTVGTTEILSNAGKPAKDAILKPYEGSPIFEESQKDVDKTLEIAQDSYSSFMEEAQPPDQSFGSEVVANDVASDKQSFIVDGTIPSILDFNKVQKDIEEEIKPSVAKEKEEAFKSSMSGTPDDVPIEGAIVREAHTEIYIGEQPRTKIGEHPEWEILKSIVYGGLVESITSLGVVSSATATGSAPLNIIAFGLANLIGGLFVISHNLIELKNDHPGEDSLQMNVQDRYQELLGRRANFLFHAVVAVLSYLIFGSVPLVVYGLLIRVHYYEKVKIAAVAASSIICIILLAIGKVYTSRPPKTYVKTMLQYVTLGIATWGISYIAGDLVKHLLEKISGSESGNVLRMPLSDITASMPY